MLFKVFPRLLGLPIGLNWLLQSNTWRNGIAWINTVVRRLALGSQSRFARLFCRCGLRGHPLLQPRDLFLQLRNPISRDLGSAAGLAAFRAEGRVGPLQFSICARNASLLVKPPEGAICRVAVFFGATVLAVVFGAVSGERPCRRPFGVFVFIRVTRRAMWQLLSGKKNLDVTPGDVSRFDCPLPTPVGAKAAGRSTENSPASSTMHRPTSLKPVRNSVRCR